jgi:undecaprenyl diphosphate synthase
MTDNNQSIPRHVGIIMDGNRRWAKERGWLTVRGHRQGEQTLREAAHHIFDAGVEYLSVYAFSTENWQRAETEVSYLMRQVKIALKRYIDEFVDEGVRIRFLGVRDNLDKGVLQAIEQAETATAGNRKATLAICFNYGGQQEIVDAMKALLREGADPDTLDIETVTNKLYAPDIPPIDLLIRTSGEQRISNFMLWRAAYAELAFSELYWPDFSGEEFDRILKDYMTRGRRFGK